MGASTVLGVQQELTKLSGGCRAWGGMGQQGWGGAHSWGLLAWEVCVGFSN